MTSVSKPSARRVGQLFVSLLDSVADLPGFADLDDKMFWQISPPTGLCGSLYETGAESPLDVLARWQEQFGGIVIATHETNGNAKWHRLETMLDGVDVKLRVPVPQASIEAKLREENAALRAALQAAIDAPVPYALVEDVPQ